MSTLAVFPHYQSQLCNLSDVMTHDNMHYMIIRLALIFANSKMQPPWPFWLLKKSENQQGVYNWWEASGKIQQLDGWHNSKDNWANSYSD